MSAKDQNKLSTVDRPIKGMWQSFFFSPTGAGSYQCLLLKPDESVTKCCIL
ncbi:unnamed protein product [Tetraodon nigroviridis]|uniref:Chromosome undetermined SCAF12073, whole genome shotgun sequence n=1 Tax=Tetraodon nigroviridis TaxID=99883 RepID=Q4SYF7_TETNG|nr:unnamed protein product [Tetraodon nigroviridis]